MSDNNPHQTRSFLSISTVSILKRSLPILLLIGLCFSQTVTKADSWHDEPTDSAFDTSSGIPGYVVGTHPVAAYTCPDTAKCAVKMMLQPGTRVLIIDNVQGGPVPGTNSNLWRKIVYQGTILYVPLIYISLTAPENNPSASTAADISLVETSDASFTPPSANTGTAFVVAPGSAALPIGGGPGTGPLPPWAGCWPINTTLVNINGSYCCPPGYTVAAANGDWTTPNLVVVCSAPGGAVTWYTPTDGRINGNSGDRIAVYCRKTGRIEVWSINNSQGHFLVEFKHEAVDAAGQAGFHVTVGNQGIVSIGGDGHGQYWVSLYGGPYHATGTGDFAKTFTCYTGH